MGWTMKTLTNDTTTKTSGDRNTTVPEEIERQKLLPSERGGFFRLAHVAPKPR
jgi:hypothetical protein